MFGIGISINKKKNVLSWAHKVFECVFYVFIFQLLFVVPQQVLQTSIKHSYFNELNDNGTIKI